MTPTSSAVSWAGQYQLHPGQPIAITGQRPVLAPGQLARLLRGQTADLAVQTLGQLFSVCAHAHRTCARRATAAALTGVTPAENAWDTAVLCRDTARDHLRCIALDWPQRLLGLEIAQQSSLDWLGGCPLPLATPKSQQESHVATESLQLLAQWLSTTVLQMHLPDWLSMCREPGAFLAWCQSQAHRLPPARALVCGQPLLGWPELPFHALLPVDAPALHSLAQCMWDTPGFCEHPVWNGACAETGAWARWRSRKSGPPNSTLSAWSRLGSRWVELVDIAQHANADALTNSHPPLLAQGTLVLGERRAMAWCEMARGLLIHAVALDDQGRIEDYRVLAPTEWNFHPRGTLGQAVQSLSSGDFAHARLLAAAFDPCVACEV